MTILDAPAAVLSVSSTRSRYAHPADHSPAPVDASSQNIGSLAAYPFAPYLSDGIGQRPAIFIGATIMIAAVAIQSAATNIGMFIAAR